MDQVERKLSKASVFSFGMGEFGRATIQTLLSTFMLFYLVNYAGVNATPVGIIILVARIWDAINDPIMGYIVDNTKDTKLGKARTYILYFTVPAVLLTFMLFAVPNGFSHTTKVVWVAIGYIVGGTFLTAVDVPYNTLMVRITESPLERMSLARSKQILNVLGFMLPVVLVPKFVETNNPGLAYTRIIGVICIIVVISYMIVVVGTKEIVKTKQKNKFKFKDGITVLAKNSSWIKLVLIFFLYSVQYWIITGVLLFYLASYFKRVEMMTTIMIIGLIASLFAIIIAKSLSKKFGKRNVLVGGLILGALGMFIRILTGDPNLIVYIICSTLHGAGSALCLVSVPPMVADTIDYNEVKTGMRVESLACAGLTFGSKTGTGISTAILAIMLDKSGYIKGVVEQTPIVIKTMFTASAIIPFIILIIMIIIGLSYKLDKQMPEISKQLNCNKI